MNIKKINFGKIGLLNICAPQNGGGQHLANNKLFGELLPIVYQVNDSLQVSGESVKVDAHTNTVALSYGFNNTLSLIRNALSSQILTTTVNSVVNTYQLVTGNKKGSTANATSSNNNFINHCANDNSDNNANLFNILVQRGLIVNYSPDCLVLRFSDLSFFSQASITHAEKLEFSRSTLESISSSNSCGNLIPLVVDLLFLYPVAIYRVSLNWCRNTIQEFFQFKILDVFIHLDIRCLCTLVYSGAEIATPRSARNTIEAFNHNVKRGNTMAMYKSTQTHPKFLWRFFSCQQFKYFLVEATSEQEARSMLPDSPCLFSARIRQGASHA